MPAGYLRFEAMMLRADLLLSQDQLPPEPKVGDANIWKRYVALLKKKKNEITMQVIEKRKECQKIRKSMTGHLPLAEPRLPLMPLWEEYQDKLKKQRAKILKVRNKGLEYKKKLGEAGEQLLVEPKELNLRKWETYCRAAHKLTSNVIPLRETALGMRDELPGAPPPPEVWEKSLWRDYIQRLRHWKKDAQKAMKDSERFERRLRGNTGMPKAPGDLNATAWLKHVDMLKEFQKQIDATKEKAKKLKNEFKGTPDVPMRDKFDMKGEPVIDKKTEKPKQQESNVETDWMQYIKSLQKTVDAIEAKRADAQVWIDKFVKKLGVPEADMPSEPPRPYSIEDWEEHIKKLSNMEEELAKLKVEAKALYKDEAFRDNKELQPDLPKIESPKKWEDSVAALKAAIEKVKVVVDKGEALKKEMEEGNELPDSPGGKNVAQWEEYIKQVDVTKATITELFPYAEGLREDGGDKTLTEKIKKCRKPKNMALSAWKDHIKALEQLNPSKKHKNIDRDAKVPLDAQCKITGFHFYKFPLHNGFGTVTKVILLDPYTIGYEVTLEDGKWLNAQTNKFEVTPIEVKDENIRLMPSEQSVGLKKMMDDVRKQRGIICQQHLKQQKGSAQVKKIQNAIRECTGQDGKEKRLRAKRTKLAQVGVMAGKKKTKAQKALEKMEANLLNEMTLATSTWVYLNGIMNARKINEIIQWVKDMGFDIKSNSGIKPDTMGYELAVKIEFKTRAVWKKFTKMKEIGKGGRIDCGQYEGEMFNTEGNNIKVHAKIP